MATVSGLVSVTTVQRDRSVDVVRGFAIVALIYFHACYVPFDKIGLVPSEFAAAVNYGLAPFRMQTLMFLSGTLLARSLEKPVRDYYLGKVRKLYWPYLVWLIPLLLSAGWQVFVGYYFYNPTLSIFLGVGYLWFLAYLFGYYLIAPVFRSVHPAIPVLLAVGFCLAIGVGEDFYNFFYYAIFFFAGNLVVRLIASPGSIRIPWWVALLCLVPATVQAITTVTTEHSNAIEVAWIPANLAGIVVALWCAQLIDRTPIASPFAWVGKNSVVFYLSHWPVIVVASLVLARFGLGEWAVPAGFAAAIVVGSLLSRLRHVVPFVWLFEAPRPIEWYRARRGVTREA